MQALLDVYKKLSDELELLSFQDPVTHVYNPLVYAWEPFSEYVKMYAKSPQKVILVGMNPGPWGMAQTGVPFGEISYVRDWMKVRGRVGKPPSEHPKRPVDGFQCGRSEVSGSRLWGWAADSFGDAENFFSQFWVTCFCPLSFMEESGRNRTPDKLSLEERKLLYPPCQRALKDTMALLEPDKIMGIGGFAYKQCQKAFGKDKRLGKILHPSPASPIANRGWAERAKLDFAAFGIEVP